MQLQAQTRDKQGTFINGISERGDPACELYNQWPDLVRYNGGSSRGEGMSMQAMGDRWEEGEGRCLEIKGAPMKAGEGDCRHGEERSTGTVGAENGEMQAQWMQR